MVSACSPAPYSTHNSGRVQHVFWVWLVYLRSGIWGLRGNPRGCSAKSASCQRPKLYSAYKPPLSVDFSLVPGYQAGGLFHPLTWLAEHPSVRRTTRERPFRFLRLRRFGRNPPFYVMVSGLAGIERMLVTEIQARNSRRHAPILTPVGSTPDRSK